MVDENPPPDETDEIPEDAMVVAQAQYAWLWSSMPLMAVLGVLLVFGVFPDPVMPAVIFLIILVPKYFQWRRTSYTLAKEFLIYQRGSIAGSRKYQIPMSRLQDVRVKYGFFGRALGYKHINIILDNGGAATLTYVPILVPMEDHFAELIASSDSAEAASDDAAEQAGDAEADETPRRYDPGATPFDPGDPRKDDKPKE